MMCSDKGGLGEFFCVWLQFFLEEEFMQDLLGGQNDKLGASPEVIEAA